MCIHNCGAKLYSPPPPSHMHKILIIMIYYIRSLAVHSAVLSYVLISTVSYSPLCHALTCTRTYSPLWSTLPCSHMYSYIQSLRLKETHNSPLRSTLLFFHLYVWPAEYLCNPPVAWLVHKIQVYRSCQSSWGLKNLGTRYCEKTAVSYLPPMPPTCSPMSLVTAPTLVACAIG